MYDESGPVMTSSVVEPRSSSKALPKGKLAPKKVMVTVWWYVAGPSAQDPLYSIPDKWFVSLCLNTASVRKLNCTEIIPLAAYFWKN